MSKFWELIDSEPSLLKRSYEENSSLYDLAIHSWERSIAPNYFKAFGYDATYFLLYKTQADVALKRAISSVLIKEYAQAIYNIRVAVENMQIAIYAYEDPVELSKLYNELINTDEKVKKAAIKFMIKQLPSASDKFKALHKECDRFGSHQTIAHHSSYISFGEENKNIKINYIGEDREELNVGLIGITIGCMIEFHTAIQTLPAKEWIVLGADNKTDFAYISRQFEDLKIKYVPMFRQHGVI